MITAKSTFLTQELINELVDILKSHSLKLNDDVVIVSLLKN